MFIDEPPTLAFQGLLNSNQTITFWQVEFRELGSGTESASKRVVDSVGERVSWLALLPVTGRTHQLRAHCAAIGTPILGDGKYGGAAAHLAGLSHGGAAHRLHLHARSLDIPHPAGGTLSVAAPLPPHMRRMWEFLGFAADAPDPFAGLELPA